MHVRKEIGPIAVPDVIQFADGLPKTRSGKIMRRILRKIAENRPTTSATSPPWPTPASSRSWSRAGEVNPRARRSIPTGRMEFRSVRSF